MLVKPRSPWLNFLTLAWHATLAFFIITCCCPGNTVCTLGCLVCNVAEQDQNKMEFWKILQQNVNKQFLIISAVFFRLSFNMLEKLVILCYALIIGRVIGFTSGPPDSACHDANLFPTGHGFPAQNGASPYQILASNTTYKDFATLTGRFK